MDSERPSRADAEAAVRTLIRWIGEDPDREGLAATPGRVIRAYDEHFAGYAKDPGAVLRRTFEETQGYDEIVALRSIPFSSHCEHHLTPIIGNAHVGYLPDRRVVGLSKLARLVDVFAKRLQLQEKMTAQIADTITEELRPRGVGVVIEAEHFCVATRGVQKRNAIMVTSRMTGAFRDDPSTRREFLYLIDRGPR